ncbi:PDR/VanB family oxidoreductase [Herbaspirillum sp. NPDC087042]|uniref:PDR/VanB family oxidoreductase n=1 Tax=Herbaspirillum sp. NPDC087042 TaxID=3364004 RepID=UPI00380D2EF0
MTSLLVRVTKKSIAAQDIASFELAALDGQVLPGFDAGAHIDVHVPGADGATLLRQYSLCNAPGERGHYRIAVLREAASRGGSAGMHELVGEGDQIRISTPRNHFSLQPAVASRAILLFAGGIGITPILCMAQALSGAGREFALHYCARSMRHLAFHDEILASPYAGSVHFHLDDGVPEQRLDIVAILAASSVDTPIYVCGPKGYIDFVIASARAAGWDDGNIVREYFGLPAAVARDAEASFEVEVASSGARYTVPPGRSIIAVLADGGVEIPVSCEQGVCGTCITRVLAGEPDHRDLYFNDAEHALNDQMTPCCSRSRGPLLVLDL